MFLGLEAQFLEHLLKLVHLLAQLRKILPYRIGFFSAFFGGAEIGFLCSVFLILTTVARIVHSMHAPMLLAEVAMLLGASFLWDSGRRLSTRSHISFLALVGNFLA
jgi:hypothetical protein